MIIFNSHIYIKINATFILDHEWDAWYIFIINENVSIKIDNVD